MYRTVIALIIGSALAITTPGVTLAEPRDRTDTVAAAGIAVLALVAAAIAAKRRQDQRDTTSRDLQFHDRRHSSQASPEHLSLRLPEERGHDVDARARLPGACRVRDDQRAGYSRRCLQRHRYDQAALPSACAVQVGGSHLTIYRDRCLNGYGYY